MQKAPDSNDLTWLEGSIWMSVINYSSLHILFKFCSHDSKIKPWLQNHLWDEQIFTDCILHTFVPPNPHSIGGRLGNTCHPNFPMPECTISIHCSLFILTIKFKAPHQYVMCPGLPVLYKFCSFPMWALDLQMRYLCPQNLETLSDDVR